MATSKKIEDAAIVTEKAAILKVKHLVSKRGNFSLNNICFDLNPGDALGVLGSNGSGKTHLLRACLGLEKVLTGNIDWCERSNASTIGSEKNPAGTPDFASGILQNNWVWPNISVEENILADQPTWRFSTKETLPEPVHAMGLEALLERPAWALSGGQKQRVAIARAFCSEKQTLILDEPTSALDSHFIKNFIELCSRHIENDGTIILVSHSFGVLKSICNRYLFLENGCMQSSGIFDQIMSSEVEEVQTWLKLQGIKH